ncbi:hypothetical protein C1141_19645, partial [Vibrio agarivorans]
MYKSWLFFLTLLPLLNGCDDEGAFEVASPNYVVSVISNQGGEIFHEKDTVKSGALYHFEVSPNAGYKISNVAILSGDCRIVPSIRFIDNKTIAYTVDSIESDCNIDVEFQSFLTTPPSTLPESVSNSVYINVGTPSGSFSLPESNKEFQSTHFYPPKGLVNEFLITPDEGYRLRDVYVAGERQCTLDRNFNSDSGTSIGYAVSSASGRCNITINFEEENPDIDNPSISNTVSVKVISEHNSGGFTFSKGGEQVENAKVHPENDTTIPLWFVAKKGYQLDNISISQGAYECKLSTSDNALDSSKEY